MKLAGQIMYEGLKIRNQPAFRKPEKIVLDVATDLLKIYSFPAFFNAAAAGLAKLLGANGAALIVCDGADRLKYRLFHGLESLGQIPITKFTFPADQGTAGHALTTGKYIYTPDYASSDDAMPEFITAGLSGNLVLPLSGPAGPLGVLAVSWLHQRAPRLSDDILAHAEFFAALIANALYREGLERKLENRSFTDSLTGLPNRRLFMIRLHEAQKRALRRQSLMVLAVLDLDGFKKINDSLGHVVGDQRLCLAAAALSKSIRDIDMAARLGGDEFVIILEDLYSLQEVNAILSRVVEAVAANDENHGNEYKLTTSVGAAIYPLDFVGPEALIRHADEAMYEAKRNGGNQFQIYTGDC